MRDGRLLIVDDDAPTRSGLVELLRGSGYAVESAGDGFKALAKLDEFRPDVVLTDLKMPGLDGMGLLRAIRARDPESVILVMTAHGAIDSAVEAIREGALDYLEKPFEIGRLQRTVERGLEIRSLRRAWVFAEASARTQGPNDIVASGPEMMAVMRMVGRVAGSCASVLITGEPGTGKARIAATIHALSARAAVPIVRLSCGGSEDRSVGDAVDHAEGGSLLLEDVDRLDPASQVELLRLLEEKRADVRMLTCSSVDIESMTRNGSFRGDLYYRLNVVGIDLPPLRARVSDIPALAIHFLQRRLRTTPKMIRGFSDRALRMLAHHSWHGNLVELEAVVEHVVLSCRGEVVDAADLPKQLRQIDLGGEHRTPLVPGATLAELERHAILKTLEHTGGSTSRAAAILGISTRKIQYRLNEYEDATDAGDGAESGGGGSARRARRDL